MNNEIIGRSRADVEAFARSKSIDLYVGKGVHPFMTVADRMQADGDLEGYYAVMQQAVNTALGLPLFHAGGVTMTDPRDSGATFENFKPIVIVTTLSGAFTDRAYVSALHEFGHLFAPGGRVATGPGRLTSEIAAWRWAKAHSEPWTPDMYAYMSLALNSYGIQASEV